MPRILRLRKVSYEKTIQIRKLTSLKTQSIRLMQHQMILMTQFAFLISA